MQHLSISIFVTCRVGCVHLWCAGLSVAGTRPAGPGAGQPAAGQSLAAVQLWEGSAYPCSHLGARLFTTLLQPHQTLCADF